MTTTDCAPRMTKAEEDAQKIRLLETQVRRLQGDLAVYMQVEEVLVAARLVSKSKIEEAHSIVDHLRNAVSASGEHAK
jgi:hypothetical protein